LLLNPHARTDGTDHCARGCDTHWQRKMNVLPIDTARLDLALPARRRKHDRVP
jgi:hypothetical protein